MPTLVCVYCGHVLARGDDAPRDARGARCPTCLTGAAVKWSPDDLSRREIRRMQREERARNREFHKWIGDWQSQREFEAALRFGRPGRALGRMLLLWTVIGALAGGLHYYFIPDTGQSVGVAVFGGLIVSGLIARLVPSWFE